MHSSISTVSYLSRGALVIIAFALLLSFGGRRRKRDTPLLSESEDSTAPQVNAKERFMNYLKKKKKCNKKNATSVCRPNDYNIMII